MDAVYMPQSHERTLVDVGGHSFVSICDFTENSARSVILAGKCPTLAELKQRFPID
jgi:hypothetical protein